MTHNIDKDQQRFRDIVKSKIRKDLKKYISNQDMIASKNGRKVRVPMPQIKIPKFTYGRNKGGIGMGDGEIGDAIGKPIPGLGGDGLQPGDVEKEHGFEVELDIDDLAAILSEELSLPRIEPRGDSDASVERYKYNSISRQGPPGLRHLRRSYTEALKRTIISGTYDPTNPVVIPCQEDWRYKSFRVEKRPAYNAAMIYMLDVSGSMDEYKKKIVRSAAFWLDAWIQSNYKRVERVFILHDIQAWEAKEKDFYLTKTSGGTRASCAYELCLKIAQKRFPITEWNVYPFHFTDGDNWPTDNDVAIKVMTELLGHCNQFCYGEVNPTEEEESVTSWYTVKTLHEVFTEGLIAENLVTTKVKSIDGILPMLKEFLGAGR